MSKFERHLPLAVGILFALPTLIARYLPMSDLPLHEGVVGVLRHLGDERYFPPGLYRLNLGHPNQLFHILAWALSYVVSTSMACKVVVAASQIGIMVGGARLATYLGRSRYAVVLFAPLALGFTYYWGLVANLVGYAILLFALPALDRAVLKPSLKGMLHSCALFLLFYFGHEAILISAGGIVALFAILRPLELRVTAMRLAPVGFGAALTLVHKWWQAQFFTKAQFVPAPIFLPLLNRLKLIPNVLFGSHDTAPQLILMAFVLGILALLIVGRRREDRAIATTGIRDRLWGHRLELAGLCHVLGYFAAPFNWNGATLVHERFIGPAWVLVVLAAAPREISFSPRIVRVIAPLLPVAMLLLSWPQFVDADATYKHLDVIIAHIPYGSRVTQAVVDRAPFATRVYSAGPSPARIVAERGGRVGLSLMTSPISPVQVAPKYRWDDYETRLQNDGSMTLQPDYDLDLFEWLVVESRDPDTRKRCVLALAGDAVPVIRSGEYVLFHSTHELVPILSPDRPSPDRDTHRLVDRLYELEVRRVPLPADEVRGDPSE